MPMTNYFGTNIDIKNIGLAKILWDLRQDLDIHCLISVNAAQINHANFGKLFEHIRRRVIGSIVLGICKVYEPEKRNELNSITGIINVLLAKNATPLNGHSITHFIRQYDSAFNAPPSVKALQRAFDTFVCNRAYELDRFKSARDKIVAHSEFLAEIDSI